jgi:hypothetical protein
VEPATTAGVCNASMLNPGRWALVGMPDSFNDPSGVWNDDPSSAVAAAAADAAAAEGMVAEATEEAR